MLTAEPELVRALWAVCEVCSNSPVTSCGERHSTPSPERIFAALNSAAAATVAAIYWAIIASKFLKCFGDNRTRNTEDPFYRIGV